MKITKFKEIDAYGVITPGVKNFTKKVLVGPDDGSINIIVHHFSLVSGNYSPRHKHDLEHLIQV